MKMTNEARANIKKNEVKNCTKCNSKKSYTNPFAKCFECKKRFCLDCLWRGLINPKMNDTDEARDVCDKCKSGKGYK